MDAGPKRWRLPVLALFAPLLLLAPASGLAQNRDGDGIKTSSAYLNRQIREAREDGVVSEYEARRIERIAWQMAKNGKISWREARRIDRWEDRIDRRRDNGPRDRHEDRRDRRNYRYN